MKLSPPIFMTILFVLLSGCQDAKPWELMSVTLPAGSTPEATFDEMRQASYDRDLAKMYGCMTAEARRDQISTLVVQMSHLVYVADLENKTGTTGRFNYGKETMKRAHACLKIFDTHNLRDVDTSSSGPRNETFDQSREYYGKHAIHVTNPDLFTKEAWEARFDEGESLFDAEANLTELEIVGDYAVAKVNDFEIQGDDDSIYIHFKKIDGKWLVDLSPWWIPWGPPLNEVQGD